MQTTKTYKPSRKEHVWHYRRKLQNWKCVLCGGVSKEPGEVEVQNGLPERFEKLTDEERALCPYLGNKT